MNYYDFKGKFLELCSKKLDSEPSVSDILYIYKRYRKTTEIIHSRERAIDMLRCVNYNKEERLKYRHRCANEGIELTPYQVDLYIIMIEMAAKQYLGDW